MTKVKGVYYNAWLHENLLEIQKLLNKDFDTLIIVDGEVGSGKSVLAMQICSFIDPSFDVGKIAFSGEEFRKIVINAQPGTAVLFDEAMSGLHSRSAMQKENKLIVRMLAEVRQKNLFFVLCLPSFFDLDRSVAVYRSKALIHCYTRGSKRGQFLFYGPSKKKDLYIKGKKYYDYSVTHSWPRPGDFTGEYVVDEEAYRERKRKALFAYLDDEGGNLSEKDVELRVRQEIAHRMYSEPLKSQHGFTQAVIADVLGVVPRTVRRYLEVDIGQVEGD